jgi:antitoxin MazE
MITKLRGRSQITLPNEILKKMKLNEGDALEITVEDDRIIVKPVVIIDRTQAWFWTKEWQEKEKEVEQDIKKGKINHAKDVKDLITKLET